MAHSETDRKALGKRLASARNLKGYTIESAAKKLTELGYPITKGGVGAWEAGRNVPDALWLRRLAKLYGTTLDALVWDDSITIEGIQFGAQFDSLDERQRRTFKAMWLAFFQQATSDADVEQHLPSVPQPAQQRNEK